MGEFGFSASSTTSPIPIILPQPFHSHPQYDGQPKCGHFPNNISLRSLDELDSFRLLHLYPASSSQAEVKCSLIQTTLQFCGNIYEYYTAISYVWGDPNDTRIICIDEIPVATTVNLFSALRDLRHETRTLLVWADAICINQHDDEEKLKQIAMMGEIYSMADHTVIYLGCLNTQDALKLDGWASTNFEQSHFTPEIADLILSRSWFHVSGCFRVGIF